MFRIRLHLSGLLYMSWDVREISFPVYILTSLTPPFETDGLGPLLFSPLSEIPSVGRNIPYIVTFGIFVILCAPTATVNNFGGLIALRFLQGYFGSPCLATGAASMGDMVCTVRNRLGH